jgi:ribosomal protein S18 acetylase RimI-like enzyme
MKISRLTREDIKSQAVVHALSFREGYKGIIPDSFLRGYTPEKREIYFIDEFKRSVYTFTVKDNGTLIGFSTVGRCRDDDKDASVGEVWGLYIHPEYWSRGYGSALFDFVISELRNIGFREITLWVLEENKRARSFYRQKGFFFDGIKKEINLGKRLIKVRYQLKCGLCA